MNLAVLPRVRHPPRPHTMAANPCPSSRHHPSRRHLDRGLSKHEPHPATVAQQKRPHPAKEPGAKARARFVEPRGLGLEVSKPRPPHPATVAQAKMPHLAKVLQTMEASGPSAPRTWAELRDAYYADGRRHGHAVIGEMGRVTGKGWLYALIAQAIRNDVSAFLHGRLDEEEKLDPVIAVTEVSHRIEGVADFRVWLVGASIREPFGELMLEALATIHRSLEAFVHPDTVVVVPSNGYGEPLVGDEAAYWRLDAGTVLHAEQQIVTYIENMPVQPVAREIGVAHVLGPCSERTAGRGSQECANELTRRQYGAAWLTHDSAFFDTQLSRYFPGT